MELPGSIESSMTRSKKGVEHVAEIDFQHVDFGRGNGNIFGPIVGDGDFVSRVDRFRSRIIPPQTANAIAICVPAGGNLLMRARRMSHSETMAADRRQLNGPILRHSAKRSLEENWTCPRTTAGLRSFAAASWRLETRALKAAAIGFSQVAGPKKSE